jgi:hypothetical protein
MHHFITEQARAWLREAHHQPNTMAMVDQIHGKTYLTYDHVTLEHQSGCLRVVFWWGGTVVSYANIIDEKTGRRSALSLPGIRGRIQIFDVGDNHQAPPLRTCQFAAEEIPRPPTWRERVQASLLPHAAYAACGYALVAAVVGRFPPVSGALAVFSLFALAASLLGKVSAP